MRQPWTGRVLPCVLLGGRHVDDGDDGGLVAAVDMVHVAHALLALVSSNVVGRHASMRHTPQRHTVLAEEQAWGRDWARAAGGCRRPQGLFLHPVDQLWEPLAPQRLSI